LAALGVVLAFGLVLFLGQRASSQAALRRERDAALAEIRRSQLLQADRWIEENRTGDALAQFAAVLRGDPDNTIAAHRIVSLLAHRDFVLPRPVPEAYALDQPHSEFAPGWKAGFDPTRPILFCETAPDRRRHLVGGSRWAQVLDVVTGEILAGPVETTLLSDTAGWTLIRDWDAEDVRGAGAEWPTGSTSFQSLSMHSSGGKVFVIGTRNTKETTPLLPGTDQAVLYEIEGWDGGLVPLKVTQLREQAFSAFAHGDGIIPTAFVYNGNFLAGACTHVTPAGELLMYAVEHYTHGPSTSVRFVEWRHQHIASPEGKLLAPRGAVVLPDFLPAGTHSIHMTNLTTYAMRPWIQLYDHDDFGGTRVTIDYPDFDRDDYNDLRKLDGSVDGFNDRTSSMRWWAPPGWRVRLYDADNFGGGEPTYTLNCNGTIQSIANLSAKPYEFDNGDQINLDETRLTSIRFLPPEFETYEDIVRGIKVEWFVFSTTPGAATIEGRSLARAQLQLHTPGALVTVTG